MNGGTDVVLTHVRRILGLSAQTRPRRGLKAD